MVNICTVNNGIPEIDKIRISSRVPDLVMAKCILETVLCLTSVAYTMATAQYSSSKCKLYTSNWKLHADCQKLGLANTFSLSLETSTTIIDLSGNDFTKLHGNEFLDTGLRELMEINLRNNHIRQVDELAFNGLSKLKNLDLSQNQIYFLDLAFWSPLVSLNLSHNPLDQSFKIRCPYLQTLDLSFCKITSLLLNDKNELPNLQHLNLTSNQITKTDWSKLQYMSLKSINLNRNPLECNMETENFIHWLQQNQIQFSPTCSHRGNLNEKLVRLSAAHQNYILPTNNHMEPNNYDVQLSAIERKVSTMRTEQLLFLYMGFAMQSLSLILIVALVFAVARLQRMERTKIIEYTADRESSENELPPPYGIRNMEGFTI